MDMQVELMNEYISKQNKMIGELVNKNLMLEAQLAVAQKELAKYAAENSSEEDYK